MAFVCVDNKNKYSVIPIYEVYIALNLYIDLKSNTLHLSMLVYRVEFVLRAICCFFEPSKPLLTIAVLLSPLRGWVYLIYSHSELLFLY